MFIHLYINKFFFQTIIPSSDDDDDEVIQILAHSS